LDDEILDKIKGRNLLSESVRDFHIPFPEELAEVELKGSFENNA